MVGGLFVLGLLCGEQARAADGVVPPPSLASTEAVRAAQGSAEWLDAGSAGQPAKASEQRTGERSVDSNSGTGAGGGSTSPSSAGSPQLPLPVPVPSSEASAPNLRSTNAGGADFFASAHSHQPPLTEHVVRPVAEGVVRPVTERVVRPVTEGVVPPAAERVVRPIGDLVGRITGGLAESPAPPKWWPALPQLPTLPGRPGLPGLPGVPGLPAVPGQTLPVGSVPQQPDGSAEKPATAEKKARDEGSTVHGPRYAAARAAAGDDVRHHTAAHGTRAAQAPVQQVPDGDPTGALGRHSAVDNGSPRHGDAQAVALNERARPTLVPGAAADVTAAGTRDRHRDVPAFPG